MKLTNEKILTIAETLLENQGQFDIYVDGVQLLDGEFFIFDLIHHLWDFSFFYLDDGAVQPYNGFVQVWLNFVAKNQDTLKAIYNDTLIVYDPLATYQREITTAYKNTRDLQHGKTETTTPNTTNTTTYGSKKQSDVTTFDSAVYRDDLQAENSGTDTVSTTGSITNTNTGTDTTTDTRFANDNIVTENGRNNGRLSDDLASDITYKIKSDFTDIVMLMFKNDNLVLLPGVD